MTSGKSFLLPQDGQNLPHGIAARVQGLHTLITEGGAATHTADTVKVGEYSHRRRNPSPHCPAASCSTQAEHGHVPREPVS